MTRDTVLAQIAAAKAAIAAHDCDRASAALQLAWDDLGALSSRGESPSAALKLHKKIAQQYTSYRRRCVGEGLIAPTYRAAHNPDLLAPHFSGFGDDGSLALPSPPTWMVLGVIGVAASAVVIGMRQAR